MPTTPDLWTQLAEAIRQDGFLLAASGVFGLAILHAFAAPLFARAAHKLEEAHQAAVREGRVAVNERGESSSLRAALMHLLGEVEAVFADLDLLRSHGGVDLRHRGAFHLAQHGGGLLHPRDGLTEVGVGREGLGDKRVELGIAE